MKSISRYSLFAAAVLIAAPLWFSQPASAKDKKSDSEAEENGSNSAVDPGEEAKKIRALVKIALHDDATQGTKDALSDEIKFVEKNKKLRENVMQHLLQDEDFDPTLPTVAVVHYKDGKVRGVLFVQTDAPKGKTPNRLGWAVDPKLEQQETSR